MAILDGFLTSIAQFLAAGDATQLMLYLRVEPPLPDTFEQLRNELKTSWQDDQKLERLVEKLVPRNDDDQRDPTHAWRAFQLFLKAYLIFWREVDFPNWLDTHERLSELAASCMTAFSYQHGLVLLKTTESLCRALARLATMLDKRPDLTAKVRQVEEDPEARKTLVEMTAESIQRAFTICLVTKTASQNGVDMDGNPEGKKIGIYTFSNMVLKLLFQCRKTRLSNQIFTNITANSPRIQLYPASQRVSYLYYLGRYHFSNNHFYYAQACLQAAYTQCYAGALKQRRQILIYLITCNMILGRFPAEGLAQRREAADLLDKFVPISSAIKKGDMIAFKHALGKEAGNERWFFKYGIHIQLLSRCEVLVWRSLCRRVFLLTYQFPSDPTSRKAPTLDLQDLEAAAQYCQKRLEGWQRPVNSMTAMQAGRVHPNAMFMKSPDLEPPPHGRKRLGPYQGVVYGNKMPEVHDVEAIVVSLIKQDLLHGYLSHNQSKFAIIGSKQKGALVAGFPEVWEVLRRKADRDGRGDDVPGWVQRDRMATGGVVNLTGIAKPVGFS